MGEGGGDAGLDAGGAGGVGLGEDGEAFAETCGVLLRDGEDSDAALGAAGSADKVWAAASGGGGQGGGDDLDEVLVVTKVWNCCRHGVPPPPYRFCIIFQTNHLSANRFAGS